MGELREIEKPISDVSEIGVVLERSPVTIDGDESLASRITVGAVAGGIVGGVATAITEPGFSTSKAWRYYIKLSDGQYATLISRSVVQSGRCASIKKYAVNELPILQGAKQEECSHITTQLPNH